MPSPVARQAILLSGGAGKPVWQANFLTVSSLPAGLTYTKSGSIPATLFDSTGKLTYQGNNLLTYSNKPGQSPTWGWSSHIGTITSLNSLPDPVGGNSASLVTFAGQFSALQAVTQATSTVGVQQIKSIWIKWVSGNTNLYLMHGAFGNSFTPITVTSQWQQFYYVEAATNVYEGVGVQDRNASNFGSVQIYQAGVSAVTYETTPRPQDQVITTSSIYLAPRLDTNPATLSPAGLLVEEQRVQIAGYNRDLTNAVWTASNITPLKNMTGLDGVANSASRITAGANNGTILQTITLASSQRAQSAYLQRITGSGTVYMTTDGGTTWVDVTSQVGSAGTWARATIAAQTVTNPSFGFKLATSGDAIGVDIVQNEGGAFPTSPIPNPTSSTVTRTADVVTPTTYASKASIWQRLSESAGTTARTYYAPGALPSPFPTGYWYQSMAAYPRALTTAEQTPRLVVGAPY